MASLRLGRTWKGAPRVREVSPEYALEFQAKDACARARDQMVQAQAQAAQVQQLAQMMAQAAMLAALQLPAAIPVACSAVPMDIDEDDSTISECAPLLLDGADDDDDDAAATADDDDDDEVPALGAIFRHSMTLRPREQNLSPTNSQRHDMVFNIMQKGSDHSHRMHKKNKPKHYLPRRDICHTEAMLMLTSQTPYAYSITNLHSRPHCSVPNKTIDMVVKDYESNGIPWQVVERKMQGADGKVRVPRFGFSIAYDQSRMMQLVAQRAPGVEDDLLAHLIQMHKSGQTVSDAARLASFRSEVNHVKVQGRMRCGHGQGQGHWSPAYREYKGVSTPSLKAESFMTMNQSLRKKLYWVLSLAAEEVKREHPGAFGDDLRQEIFGGLMREALGCEENDPHFPWEYIDILVTCDTALARHCDHLNDWRPGYNHTSVYSYHRTVEGAEYKVSIIMTTRKSVGRAVERIREELNL